MSSLPTVPLSSSRDANALSEMSELPFEDQAVLALAIGHEIYITSEQ
jgi:hypothetical protein